MKTSLAEITIFALIALALCCQGLPVGNVHADMGHVSTSIVHLNLLATSNPVPLVSALVLLLVLIGLSIFTNEYTLRSISALTSREERIDIASPPPLQLAFSDGILNTKRF